MYDKLTETDRDHAVMNRAERRRELKKIKKQASVGARKDAKEGGSLEAARKNLETAKRLHNSDKRAEALSIYKTILASLPNEPEVLHLMGIALFQEGKDADARAFIEKSIKFDPGRSDVHNDLGNIYTKDERFEDAIARYKVAIELQHDFADAHYNLGYAYFRLKKLEDAVASFETSIELEPKNAVAQNTLGIVLKDLGNYERALECFEAAISANKLYLQPYTNMGVTLLALGRRGEALEYFEKSLENTRGPNKAVQPQREAEYTTLSKFSHDIEQFDYLSEMRIGGPRYKELATKYRHIKSEINWPRQKTALVRLKPAHRTELDATYVRPIHLVEGSEVSGASLNSELNTQEITNAYKARAPGMVYIDNFLSSEALEELNKFLLQSTIWFKYNYSGGYLGAMFADGLACPILLQIADDTRRAFPELLEPHPLAQLWAYKYDHELYGIGLHADFAAVNLNFWLTPSSANLDPSSGGLVVYDTEAPLSWNFDAYNKNPEQIRKFLSDKNSGKMVVPYAQNRAVLFNSNLFHETDTINFKKGYENRRINITMLFGKRS